MGVDPLSEKHAKLAPQIQQTWARYRQFIIGLTGLHGEILAAHLAVEAEMESRLRLLISNPDALLERASYAQKIALLEALWPGPVEVLRGSSLDAAKKLGRVRNAIAHGYPELEITRRLDDLLRNGVPDEQLDRIERLRGLTMTICGYICGLTEGVDKARISPDWTPPI